ncbi:hypothetical protein RRG08_013513 [Elysia crispata]|uniref:Uncharacterized protein n=1 Tax=Elysia crispata TaxID=231223 RepID=A0AAE0Y0R3_9GAST|nr:hypothetical protein RRG08_013513 [Elysia crispata]
MHAADERDQAPGTWWRPCSPEPGRSGLKFTLQREGKPKPVAFAVPLLGPQRLGPQRLRGLNLGVRNTFRGTPRAALVKDWVPASAGDIRLTCRNAYSRSS